MIFSLLGLRMLCLKIKYILHGLAYLKTVLEPQTRDKSSRRQLLIVDGHLSHVNLEFINFCNQNRILALNLSLHSTHRLQPLDVSLFQPLSTAYSAELDNLTAKEWWYCVYKEEDALVYL